MFSLAVMRFTNEVIQGVLVRVAALPFLSLVGAFFLRVAIKWVEKLDVKYGRVYSMVLLWALLSYALAFWAGMRLPRSLFHHNLVTPLLAVAIFTCVSFCIQSIFIKLELNLPIRRSCLVTLVYFAMGFALLVVGAILWNATILVTQIKN